MRRSDAVRPGRIAAIVAVIAGAGVAVTGCDEIRQAAVEVEDTLRPGSTPHERYARTLEDSGLGETGLVRDWRSSAVAAIENPLSIPTAYRAVVAIDPAGTAQGWRIPVRRGQRVRVRLTPGPAPVYLDAFDAEELAHAASGTTELDLLPEVDGAVIVRAQPELLREGRYTIAIHVEPSLSFPVVGRGIPDIGSVFGDPRDAGARQHHGIDIFAPRGTPVVAGAAGTVRDVETTPVGGRVVWLRTSEPRGSLYYAHLDTQLVRQGSRVNAGDTLGLVGNTGNARTTPPHLHFGIYSRGPVDPMAYVRPIATRWSDLPADSTLPGRWIRTTRAGIRVRPSPDTDAVLEELPTGATMRVTGGNADWLSVALPDGRVGFVPTGGIEATDEPMRRIEVASSTPLWSAPGPDARLLMTLEPGSDLAVYGRFDDYLWVRTSGGADGWVETTQ